MENGESRHTLSKISLMMDTWTFTLTGKKCNEMGKMILYDRYKRDEIIPRDVKSTGNTAEIRVFPLEEHILMKHYMLGRKRNKQPCLRCAPLSILKFLWGKKNRFSVFSV